MNFRKTKCPFLCMVALIITAVAFSGVSAWAQESDDDDGGDSEDDIDSDISKAEEVVVTGTRTEHAISDSPVPVELITQEEITNSGCRDAGDALGNVPGVFVDDYEAFGRGGPGSGINLHGLPTDRVLVLIDGQRIPKTMRAPDLEVIPASIIRRIEVVKGPSSALYGSDAVGGVINIITRDPTKKFTLEGEGGYGSFNTVKGNVLHSWTLGPLGYLAAFGREQSDGWIDDYSYKAITRMGVGFDGFTLVENDEEHPYELNDLFGKFRLKLGERAAWRGSARYHWEYNGAKDADDGYYDDDKTRLDTQTGVDVDMGAAGNLAVTAYYFRHTLRYRQYESIYVWDLFEPTEFYSIYNDKGNDTRTDSYRGEIVHNVLFGTWNLLTSGVDARYDALDYESFEQSDMTDEDSGYDAYQTVTSGYMQDEIMLFNDRWSLVPGWRLDYHAEWGTVFNPKFSTLVKAVKSDPYKLSVRASVGRAFKEPDLSQLYRKEFRHTGYYLTGNKDLAPEKAVGWDAEIEQNFFNRANLKLGYFQYEIEDMIWTGVLEESYVSGLPLLAYDNIKRARTYGVESSIHASPVKYVKLQLHHTYTKTLDLDADEALGTVSEHQSGAQLFVDIDPWGLGGYAAANYQSERDYIGMGGLWYTAEPRWTTKARVYKTMLNHLEVFGEFANLLGDEWDREGDGDNDMPPFSVFGGLKMWY